MFVRVWFRNNIDNVWTLIGWGIGWGWDNTSEIRTGKDKQDNTSKSKTMRSERFDRRRRRGAQREQAPATAKNEEQRWELLPMMVHAWVFQPTVHSRSLV
jgi:hypothetical protein